MLQLPDLPRNFCYPSQELPVRDLLMKIVVLVSVRNKIDWESELRGHGTGLGAASLQSSQRFSSRVSVKQSERNSDAVDAQIAIIVQLAVPAAPPSDPARLGIQEQTPVGLPHPCRNIEGCCRAGRVPQRRKYGRDVPQRSVGPGVGKR